METDSRLICLKTHASPRSSLPEQLHTVGLFHTPACAGPLSWSSPSARLSVCPSIRWSVCAPPLWTWRSWCAPFPVSLPRVRLSPAPAPAGWQIGVDFIWRGRRLRAADLWHGPARRAPGVPLLSLALSLRASSLAPPPHCPSRQCRTSTSHRSIAARPPSDSQREASRTNN